MTVYLGKQEVAMTMNHVDESAVAQKVDKVTTFNKELARFIDQSLLLPFLGRVNKFSKYILVDKTKNGYKL